MGPSNFKQLHVRKEHCPSSGGSSGTPSSSAAKTIVGKEDSVAVLSSWEAVHVIPPFDVNSLTEPTGEFWEHMRLYALEQAPYEFPWHVDWNKQCPLLKARFTLKLRKIYPGPWEPKSILRAVGANLRERRTRLKRKFEKEKKSSQVSQPAGCSKRSWLIIYESTKDAMKQKKEKLCQEAANKRFKVQGPTHRCGPRGIKGLHDQFVDYFNRPPIDGELEYGKMNGWMHLKAKIEKALEVHMAGQGNQSCTRGNPANEPLSIDSANEDVEKMSCISDSRSSDTSTNSTDSSSDDDSYTVHRSQNERKPSCV